MRKKLICAILLLFLAAAVLTSCGERRVTAKNIGDYAIVRADGASYDIRSACTDVWKEIRRLTGVELPILYESEAADYSKRIVIGRSSSAESRAFCRDLRINDFAYGAQNDCLIITGASDELTCAAAAEYCRYLRSVEDDKDPLLFGDSTAFVSRGEYDIVSLTVNGQDVRDCAVIYPLDGFDEKTAGEGLADAVLMKSGFTLEVLPDTAEYDGLKIILSSGDGSLGENEYRICTDADGNVHVSGGEINGLRSGVKKLADTVWNMSGDSVLDISDGIVGQAETLEAFSVMTFNILETTDIALRVDAVCETILEYMPDSIGFQEVNEEWLAELEKNIGEYYDFCRTSPIDKTPVFYLKNKWKMTDSKMYALSATPDVEDSRVKGGLYTRVLYILKLERISDGFTYYHANTHFQPMHDGEDERALEAGVVVRLTNELRDGPVFFTGDLNSAATEEAHSLLTAAHFYSSENLARTKLTSGTSWCGDYTNITREWGRNGSPIDYVYARGPWLNTLTYKVIREPIGGMYPSDHFPVIAEFEPIK